jgi:hypothetical protein
MRGDAVMPQALGKAPLRGRHSTPAVALALALWPVACCTQTLDEISERDLRRAIAPMSEARAVKVLADLGKTMNNNALRFDWDANGYTARFGGSHNLTQRVEWSSIPAIRAFSDEQGHHFLVLGSSERTSPGAPGAGDLVLTLDTTPYAVEEVLDAATTLIGRHKLELPDNSTRRQGPLASYHAGLEYGPLIASAGAASRARLTGASRAGLRIGAALYDTVPLIVGVGGFASNGARGAFTTVEVGGQHRLRPTTTLSFVPGMTLGFGGALELECRAQDSEGLDCADPAPLESVEVGGLFLSPFARTTFGRDGYVGLTIRSEVFLTGDLRSSFLFGLDFGLP